MTWHVDAHCAVDHVSFHVMRELGLSRAFAFDDDFRAAGFKTLP